MVPRRLAPRLLYTRPHRCLNVTVPAPGKIKQQRIGIQEELVLRTRNCVSNVPRRVDAPELQESRVVLDRVSNQLGRFRLTLGLDHNAHLHSIDQKKAYRGEDGEG